MRDALRSLALHRLRAGFSALGIVCGVVSFVAMLGVSQGAHREALRQVEQLGMRNVMIRAASLDTPLDLADARHLLAGLGTVARVGAVRELDARIVEPGRDSAPTVMAVTPNFSELQRLDIAQGRFVAEEDVRRRNLVCVLGHDVASRLGRDGSLGGTLRVQGAVCRVVGILGRLGRRGGRSGTVNVRDYDNAVLLPVGTEDAFAPHPGTVTELIAEMRSPADVMPALPGLRHAIEASRGQLADLRVVAPQELLRQADRTRRDFDVLAASLAIVCLVVGGIGIMNTMLASVTERTHEIGIRRALGATEKDILRQFIREAAALTCAGTIIGLVLGVAGVLAVSTAAGWPVAIDAWTLAVPAACASAAGLFFGSFPALRAARLDPVAALRHG